MKTKVFNEEVLFTDVPIVKVDKQYINKLKEKSDMNIRKRIRLCTHRDIENRIHEMLIIHTKDTYVRPHKHINKIESFHIIEGTADVVIYSDNGAIADVITMGEYGTGRIFYYRLSDPLFHTLRIISDYLIFHEITNGPFRRFDTVFAPWAPQGTESGTNKFMDTLDREVETFKQNQAAITPSNII